MCLCCRVCAAVGMRAPPKRSEEIIAKAHAVPLNVKLAFESRAAAETCAGLRPLRRCPGCLQWPLSPDRWQCLSLVVRRKFKNLSLKIAAPHS